MDRDWRYQSLFWVWPPHSFGSNGSNTASTISINTPSTVGSSYSINCQAVNNCGSNWTNNLIVNIGYGGGGAPQAIALSAYPNPTASVLTVEVTDSLSNQDPNKLDQSYQLVLMDKASNKVFSTNSNDKTIKIPTEGLTTDVYYLQLLYKDAILQKKIMIKK